MPNIVETLTASLSPSFTTPAASVRGISDAKVFQHDPTMELASGSIALSVTADTTSGRQGLFSKDAFGYGSGGHLTIWLENGTITLRMQSDDRSYVLDGGIVEAGTEQSVIFTFGPDGMKLYVGGQLVDQNGYTGGLQGNNEPVVIGASEWGSSAGTADRLTHEFKGTIENAGIFDEVITQADIDAALDDPQQPPVPDPEPEPEPTNAAPVIDKALALDLSEGETRTVKLSDYFSDPDGDPLTFEIGPDLPDFISFNPSTGNLTVAAKDGDDGSYSFTVTASDGTDTSTPLVAAVSVDDSIQPPAPQPDPTPAGNLIETLRGTKSTVFEWQDIDVNRLADADIAPNKQAYQLSEGAIGFVVTADSTSGLQGLFSKDASGYGNGGHVTIWLDDGKISARVQSGNASYELEGGNLTAGVPESVLLSFGETGLKLYVAGDLVDQSGYSGGLAGNAEPIVIGASQWASNANSASSLTHEFKGRIDDATIFDEVVTPADIASALGDPAPIPDPQPEPDPTPVPQPGPGSYENTLIAADGIVNNGVVGTQLWGDKVTLTAFDLAGDIAKVVFSTEFNDAGFGVAGPGSRWDGQIDYYSEGGYRSGNGNSEKLIIDFNGAVTDVTLRAGMLGITEGPAINGREMIETGTWTAFDGNGNPVGSGLIGADQSNLGSLVKEGGSYGIYPMDVETDVPFELLVLEATQFGHGEGFSVDVRNYGANPENSSDFALIGVEYLRLDAPYVDDFYF